MIGRRITFNPIQILVILCALFGYIVAAEQTDSERLEKIEKQLKETQVSNVRQYAINYGR